MKGAYGNLLTVTERGAVAVTYTKGLSTRTDALDGILRGCLVVVVLRVASLVNGGLK